MSTSLPPTRPPAATCLCKVCGTESPLDCVVDFSKNCEELRGLHLPLAGRAVFYHRCPACGLRFTCAFDDWSPDSFRYAIYNEEYARVDPDFRDSRPRHNAGGIVAIARRPGVRRVLDYGGGNGMLAAILRESGIAAESWDPLEDRTQPPERGVFDLVTAFEVFEHTPTPVETCAEALSFLRPEGAMIFSTLCLDTLAARDAACWYIAPRNGHVTLHTRRSLETLFAPHGLRVHHFTDVAHAAFREVPGWLRGQGPSSG